MARPQVGIIPLYIGYGADGTTWFSSELKGLQKHCDHIEVRPFPQYTISFITVQVFPPGHYMFGSSLSKGPAPEPIRF